MLFQHAFRGSQRLARSRSSLLYGFTLGSGNFLNSNQPSRRSSGTVHLLRTPPRSAPREVPTPLVFVSASGWDESSRVGMSASAAWFADRGYTCLEIDLGRPEGAATSSEDLMKHYEMEFSANVRLLSIPFAPVVVARAAGALIAQTYISSHPATALLLISPPPSNATLQNDAPALLPTSLTEYNFEPRFPVAIMCTKAERRKLAGSRLWDDPGVDKLIVKDEDAVTGQEGLVKIEEWLDELGI